MDLRSPRMALRAGFELHALKFVLERRQPVTNVAVPERRPARGQIDVYAPRPMALFTTYVDFLPRCFIRVAGRIVVLMHVRRVAIGACGVPVLCDAGPMQRV